MQQQEGPVKPDFTIGDLLQEISERFGLQAKGKCDETGFYRRAELEEIFGISTREALIVLHELDRLGMLEYGKKKIRALGGRKTSVDAYRLRLEETNDRED